MTLASHKPEFYSLSRWSPNGASKLSRQTPLEKEEEERKKKKRMNGLNRQTPLEEELTRN